MATFSPQEVYFVEDGQQKIELDHPYIIGSNTIQVFLNGILAVLGKDYVEATETSIQFEYQLSSEDVIIVQRKVDIEGVSVSVIGKAGNSLYQKFGDKDTLHKNQKYKLTFRYGDQVHETAFTTRIEPLYSTYEMIVNDLGPITSDIPEERILFLIFQNSILSQNIASEENMQLLKSQAVTPFVFKQYVRYRTELDIMSAVYFELSGRQGIENKVLGELTIMRRREFGMADIRTILGDLKAKLKEWDRKLRGWDKTSPLRGAVRGGSANPYPLNTPRRSYDPTQKGSS